MIRVAVDAMGGDTAPQAEIAGVVQALAALPGKFLVQLVGRPEAIKAELEKYPDADRSRIELHEAAEVIGMAEKPLAAVRRNPSPYLMDASPGRCVSPSGRIGGRVRIPRNADENSTTSTR